MVQWVRDNPLQSSRRQSNIIEHSVDLAKTNPTQTCPIFLGSEYDFFRPESEVNRTRKIRKVLGQTRPKPARLTRILYSYFLIFKIFPLSNTSNSLY